MSFSSSSHPPRPTAAVTSESDLRAFYLGKNISDVPTPAAVLDVSIVQRHCQAMLQTVRDLGVGFRAHVKTHKTTQLTRLQVGDSSKEVNLVVSTVHEFECLVPFLKDCRQAGRDINVLYGLPLPPSQATRLGSLAKELGPGSISVMIDHPGQLVHLKQFHGVAGFAACVFLKIDTGYHRAGRAPEVLNKDGLIARVISAEKEGFAKLLGVYSHNSLSYAGKTPGEAMLSLTREIEGCVAAVNHNKEALPRDRPLVVSIGATPQVVSAENLAVDNSSEESQQLRNIITNPGANVKVELHAGVYPVLDMQQMWTHARAFAKSPEEDVALTIVAEVCSVYTEREQPEALIAAGLLALGREPCPGYQGFGVVSPWRQSNALATSRLVVQRISQEHGILALEKNDPDVKGLPLEPGQKVRIWPNHACITGAMYDFYLIVDSSSDGGLGEKIVDVWTRWHGW